MLNYGGNLPRPMTQKFLYVVDHFIPFPRSEYGGIWNVVAENDDECFDLITAEDDGMNDDYYGCLLYTSPSPRDATLSRMPSSA